MVCFGWPWRSEHAACAGEDIVLSSGEISFMREANRWTVGGGQQPVRRILPSDVSSGSAAAHALDGLGRPSGFTHEVVFQRCPGCREHNIVRQDEFFCSSDIPAAWNVDPTL